MACFRVVVTGAALALCLATIGAAQDQDLRDELVQSLVEAFPPNTVTGAEVFENNGFRVESSQVQELGADLKPTGNEMQFVSVSAEGMFQVGIEKGRAKSSEGGGVAIFHRDAGTPMLSVGDRDGDGRIDVLTYGVVDEHGKSVLDVIDYEADGQADVRMNFREGFFEIWHMDRWYRAEERDGRRGIVVDGEFREVRGIDNRLTVQ
jgi:hypothetical protein